MKIQLKRTNSKAQLVKDLKKKIRRKPIENWLINKHEETKNLIDPKFFNQVSQVAHLFVGSSMVLASILFFSMDALIYSFPTFILLTGIKEFWYDRNYENSATRGSDLEDFLFYQLGAVSALLLFIIKIKIS